eukprot:jgi/Mesen1/8629/ME000050S08038
MTGRLRIFACTASFVILLLQHFLVVSTSNGEGVEYACDVSRGTADFPFCNTSLSVEARVTECSSTRGRAPCSTKVLATSSSFASRQRVTRIGCDSVRVTADLIGRLTLEEKVSRLINNASAVHRLGLPRYGWWGEGLHGVAICPDTNFGGSVACATIFPQVLGTTAAFNTTLWYLIAQAVSSEARAMYRTGRAGLTLWAPNVNIFRDPRWGRGQETPGEDPHVSASYAGHYVRGLQGEDDYSEDEDEDDDMAGQRPPRRRSSQVVQSQSLKVSAGCKHFTAYDIENWNGTDRFRFDARVSRQDLADTYQVPFHSCVRRGHASGLMCSYNLVNGVPACASRELLTDVARERWGFDGYITTDCGALYAMYWDSHYAASKEAAVAAGVTAGIDQNCGTYLRDHSEAAIWQGLISEASLEPALRNSFTVLMRLGLFDGDPAQQRWGDIDTGVVDSAEHQQLALEAARQSLVLLKNDGAALPLDSRHVRTVAMIGPHANASEAMFGNYHGPACRSVTPLAALSQYSSIVKYAPGCADVACNASSGIDSAVAAAANADATLVLLGLDLSQETEMLDRNHLLLPGYQASLLQALASASRAPLVLVLLCGGPVDVSFARDDARVSAIVWAGYPGQAGGQAIADVIFGAFNPAGRLPMTWYPESFARQVSMLDMAMRADSATGYPGRTHRFYTGPTVFAFGHGLSYTRFSYSHVTAPGIVYLPHSYGMPGMVIERLDARAEAVREGNFEVNVTISNEGARAGHHVAHLYASPPPHVQGGPRRNLIAFKRIFLEVGEAKQVTFFVSPTVHLISAQHDGSIIIEAGVHTLSVGGEDYPLVIELGAFVA